MNTRIIAVLFFAAVASAPAQAKLRAFACEPEWGALLKELAGTQVDVDVATTALQDVHQIDAKPSLIAKLRRADLLVCSGAGLEAGWLPQLLRQSANRKVASGPGSFMAVSQVVALERPAQLDRAQGDVHPEGNPHIQMDPHRVRQVARALALRLATLDAANAVHYRQRAADFDARWSAAIDRWEAQAAPLRGRAIVVHHRSWIYLEQWLGLVEIGALEPKPGVPPTSAHLSGLVELTKSQKVLGIVHAAYQDPKASRWLAERTKVPAINLPLTVGGDPQSQDLFGLFESTLAKLLGAVR